MSCARTGTEGGAGIGSRKRGPTQWGGPAEASVSVRARLLRNVAMPETGSDVLQGETALTHVVMVTHAVETLVRRHGIQRAAVGAIWTNLDIIEEGEDVVLNVFPAGIYGQRHGRISGADVGSDGHQRRSVVPLAEKQKTVHAEIVSQKLVNDSGRQLHAYILAEKRRVTALTETCTIRNINSQRHHVGNLLHDDAGHFRYIFYHWQYTYFSA